MEDDKTLHLNVVDFLRDLLISESDKNKLIACIAAIERDVTVTAIDMLYETSISFIKPEAIDKYKEAIIHLKKMIDAQPIYEDLVKQIIQEDKNE